MKITLIVYSPSCCYKLLWLSSSVESKRRYFENCHHVFTPWAQHVDVHFNSYTQIKLESHMLCQIYTAKVAQKSICSGIWGLYTDCLMLLRWGLNALTAVTTVYFDIGAEVGMQYQICMQYFSKLTFALIPFSIHFYQLLAHIFTHGISWFKSKCITIK